MLEKYTDKAKNILPIARSYAIRYGQRYIESEHLLLALLETNPSLFTPWALHTEEAKESIAREVEYHTTARETLASDANIHVSKESKTILDNANKAADSVRSPNVDPLHILMSILFETKSFAAEILQERKLGPQNLFEQMAQATAVKWPKPRL